MKTLYLKSNGLGRYDDVSPFLIAENKLELKIELPQFNGEFYLIAKNNASSFKKTISRDEVLTLENLSAGELNAEVKHYLKGELIKVYKLEPLLLKEVDGTLSAMPEIETLTSRISELEQAFDEYKKSTEERILRLEQNQTALIRFAYQDFKDNVYLGGGTAEEFAEKYGFDQETIHLLKGENEDDQD